MSGHPNAGSSNADLTQRRVILTPGQPTPGHPNAESTNAGSTNTDLSQRRVVTRPSHHNAEASQRRGVKKPSRRDRFIRPRAVKTRVDRVPLRI